MPSIAIRSGYRIPVTSKKELFVAIAFTPKAIFENFCHTELVLRWWQEFRFFSDKILFHNYQIHSFFHKSPLNFTRWQLLCQIKVTLQNIVIRVGSGTRAISKIDLLVTIALQ